MNNSLMEKRALAILNEAKAVGMLKKPVPDDNDTRLKLAEYVIEDARNRFNKGEKGKHITRILYTADVSLEQELDNDERRYLEQIEDEIETGIPVPPQIKGDVPEMPLDLTTISTTKLRQLHGAFNACAARVGWLYAYEEAGEASAKAIADHYENEYIYSADRKDIGGKPKTQQLLKIEAEKTYPQISKWRDRESKHKKKANKYKRLLDGFNLSCDRLSREFTMRDKEQNG